jgi:hypothetical protein
MRRLSGLIAILALSRFSLSGLILNCPTVAESATDQHAHGSSAASVASVQADGSTSCGTSGAADCRNAQHHGCLAMPACANALASDRSGEACTLESLSRPSVSVVELLLEPSHAPEPPPPRV